MFDYRISASSTAAITHHRSNDRGNDDVDEEETTGEEDDATQSDPTNKVDRASWRTIHWLILELRAVTVGR